MSTVNNGAGASLDDMVSGLLDQLADTRALAAVKDMAVTGGTGVDSNGIAAFHLGSGLADLPPVAPAVGISTGVAGPDAATGGVAAAGASSADASGNLDPGSLGAGIDIPTQVGVTDDDDVHGGKGYMGNGDDPTGANVSPGGPGTVLTLGTNPDGTHFFTGNRNIDATLIGSKWGTTDLTYSFPTSGSNYSGTNYDPNGVSLYHVDLGPQQQAAARAAFAQLSALTGLTFTEITDTDTVHADIRLSQTADQDDLSAYGNFASDTKGMAGDIWFSRNNQPYYDLAYKGTWGYATIMHEIGHTMGLKHGHQDYTNSDLSGYFGTSPRPGTQALTPDRDGQAWSLMTYTPAPFTNSNFAGEKMNQPQTYMQYDVAALQYLYGANYNTHSEDTTYSFSQTTGEEFINGVGQGAPAGNKIFLTVWDGGGNDTIDVSNYTTGVTIDLRPGEFSTFDQNQLANNLAYQNLTNLAPGNIAMSLLYNNDTRSLIENAKGGAGNDIFIGNTADNTFDGGAGSDSVLFTNPTGVTVVLNNTATDVVVNHDGETDTLRSIENIGGTAGNDTIVGNTQNNTLTGGSGGADNLSGGDGDDRLIGGTFSVVNNAIITKAQATANTSVGTALDPQALNAYTLLADVNTTNSTTTPHATINATSAGGGLEYYRVDAGAGSTAIFDIDNSSVDTWIELVDSTGATILADNDDSITDPGSQTGNSYLTYTFASAGTYYLRVGRWTQASDIHAQALAAGTTYTLNMSLSTATVNATPLSASNTSSAVLKGGNGNDFLQGTLGDDVLNGGAGNDTASFATAFSNTGTGVTVDLHTQGTAQNTGAAGNDTLIGIENLVGSQYNDTLTGDATNNVIEGGLGNDTLVGGGGTDTASYAGATAGVTVNLGLQGGAQNTINAGSDTLSGFTNLLGSSFNDTLTGDANANTLTGGSGDDILNPGVNAVGTYDYLDGGIGSDTASFAGYTTTVYATLNGNFGNANDGSQTIANMISIENLKGGSGDDFLYGNADANTIEGGLGNDYLDGGSGVDTVVFSGSTAVTVNLATVGPQATGWGNDTIVNFENVRTGSGADNVTGDGNDNTFFDGGGSDRYDGAAGNDTVDYTNIATTVSVNLNTATAQTVSTGNSDTLISIENVTGSLTAANNFIGNAAANVFTGGAGIDTVQGNSGNDTIYGGAGNDILLGGTSAALDDGSSDTIYGGAGNDYISGGMGNDFLYGGDGDDTLVGGVGNTSKQYYSGIDAGNDTYDGGDGSDTAIMVYDTTVVPVGQTDGIAFDLRSIAGNSAITYGGVNVGSLTSIETVIFRGTTANDTVGGTGNADNLFGGAGDDVLDGWYGNDLLEGGAGNDTLTGGEGVDTASYSTATAGVNVDLRLDGVAQNTGGAGIDTLSGIEYLTGSAYGDTLRGTDDFNLIVDNTVAFTATPLGTTDALYGYGGNDSILVTRAALTANPANTTQTVTTASTNITMDGGDGDDVIELRSGTLTGYTAATQTFGLVGQTYEPLGATSADRNVDVVTVSGGNGNDRIILTGVASATVDAGAGNDTVSISMRGASSVNNYNITLGAGADIIQFGVGTTAATSTDVAINAHTSVVTDFQVGDLGDKFEMTNYLNFGFTGHTANTDPFADGHMRLVQSGADMLLQVDRDGAGATNSFVTIFTLSNTYTGGFTAYNFDGFMGNLTLTGIGALNEKIIGATGNDTLSGMDGNDTLVGNDGDDVLDGGNGADILRGGNGNDTLKGGAGNDTLSGGAGIDKFVFDHGTGQDTVTDFLSGTDKLDLTAFGFADFAAFQAATHDDVNGNAVIDLGSGDTATLTGVHAAQLQSGDVILAAGPAQVEAKGEDVLQRMMATDHMLAGVGASHFLDHMGLTAMPAYEYML